MFKKTSLATLTQYTLLLALLLTQTDYLGAAPVTPEEAIEEASEFLNGTLPAVHNLRAPRSSTNSLEIAHVSEADNTDCFYIVNYPNGYVIISADTRLPEILGFSDNGPFDETKISPNMKWWLEQYTDEISHFLPTAQETDIRRAPIRANDRQKIDPLLKTIWNQDTPFNNSCPIDPNYGIRSVTGCVATAMAQIMKFHNWPNNPTGSNAGVIFKGTTLDWPNMLDDYSGKYTAIEAEAVALLMRQCGASVDMMYSAVSSGAYDNHVPVALTTYFNYSTDMRLHWKDYTPQKKWNELIYDELKVGRPIYYSGSSVQGGHAFVCDGYLGNDYFHFNWGWGGYQDGYYRLTALNPESGGAGSYEGGYNSNQTILTGIYPAGNEPVTQQYAILATGGFHYEDNLFVVRDSNIGGYQLFYNPLYKTEDVYFGVKFIKMDDSSPEPVVVFNNTRYSIPSTYGMTEISISLPILPDGKYKAVGIFSNDKINWEEILIPLGKQSYVTVTSHNGRLTMTNEGPDEADTSILIVGTPESCGPLYSSAQKSFRVPIANVGKGDFLGEIGLSLFGDDDFGDVISSNISTSIPGESSTILTFDCNDMTQPGQYRLYITDSDGNTLSDSYAFEILPDIFQNPSSPNGLIGSDLAPTYINSNSEKVVFVTVTNNDSKVNSLIVGFVFLDSNTHTVVKTLTSSSEITINPGQSRRLSFGPSLLGLQPGKYLWYLTDENQNILSNPAPLLVESEILQDGKYAYIITDEKAKTAVFSAPNNFSYYGVVNVPDKINGYTISALTQDAFIFSTAYEVRLPKTISIIPDGEFYSTTGFKRLLLDSPTIVNRGERTFNPEKIGSIWIGVSSDLAYDYATSESWKDFNYPTWEVTTTKDVIISSPDNLNHTSGNVFYTSPHEIFRLKATNKTGNNVAFRIHSGDFWSIGTVENGHIFDLPASGWNHSTISLESTTNKTNVDEISESEQNGFEYPCAIYSIDGRLIIMANDDQDITSLPVGLYLTKNKKFIIK